MSRSSKSSNSLDLNVQGSAIDVNKNHIHTNRDVHASCRREIEKLKRELNAEKNSNKKLKVSISELKLSSEKSERDLYKKISILEEEHKKETESLMKKHAEVLALLDAKHRDEMQLEQSKHENESEERRKKTSETNELLLDQKEKFEKLIASKNEQIETLKQQAAESFNINSKERQTQIDELMKELKVVSDEAAYLKNIVQKHSNFAKCQKCTFYESKYKDLAEEMAAQTEHCKQLMGICSKMETQLTQQDELCLVLSGLRTEIMK